MVPPLLLIRAFQNDSERGAGLYHLFKDGNETSGFVLNGDTEKRVSWTYPQWFYSPNYDEPLECAHARRSAFGGSDIQLDDAAELSFPGRYLVVPNLSNNASLYRRGDIIVEWLLTGILEVPSFCVGLALSARSRLEWKFGEERIDLLKAATTLRPNALNVVGVATHNDLLCGAFEFGAHLDDNCYLGNFIGLSHEGRELQPGDVLHGHYEGRIGETHLTAERALLRVVEVGSPHIPPLAVPNRYVV